MKLRSIGNLIGKRSLVHFVKIFIFFLFCADFSWFDGFDWDRLHRRAMTAPLKRPIRSKTDLSNFEEYPAHLERDDPPDETSGWDINF